MDFIQIICQESTQYSPLPLHDCISTHPIAEKPIITSTATSSQQKSYNQLNEGDLCESVKVSCDFNTNTPVRGRPQ